MKDNKVYLNNTTLEDFNNLWYNYFDLGRDYTQIKKELKSMDEYLDKACDFGYGIRILQQKTIKNLRDWGDSTVILEALASTAREVRILNFYKLR